MQAHTICLLKYETNTAITSSFNTDTITMSQCLPPNASLLLPLPYNQSVWSLCTPLLVFVNSRSGGQQGKALICKLRTLLSLPQVVDLDGGGPNPAYVGCTASNQ
jgi:hypothetical protein